VHWCGAGVYERCSAAYINWEGAGRRRGEVGGISKEGSWRLEKMTC
jgi:hypothetical protein